MSRLTLPYPDRVLPFPPQPARVGRLASFRKMHLRFALSLSAGSKREPPLTNQCADSSSASQPPLASELASFRKTRPLFVSSPILGSKRKSPFTGQSTANVRRLARPDPDRVPSKVRVGQMASFRKTPHPFASSRTLGSKRNMLTHVISLGKSNGMNEWIRSTSRTACGLASNRSASHPPPPLFCSQKTLFLRLVIRASAKAITLSRSHWHIMVCKLKSEITTCPASAPTPNLSPKPSRAPSPQYCRSCSASPSLPVPAFSSWSSRCPQN